MDKHTFSTKFQQFLKIFCVIVFLDCRKGDLRATSLENNLFVILSMTKSTGALVKKLVASKIINVTLFLNLSSLMLLIKLKIENRKLLSWIQGLIEESSHLARLYLLYSILTTKVTGLRRHPALQTLASPQSRPVRQPKGHKIK